MPHVRKRLNPAWGDRLDALRREEFEERTRVKRRLTIDRLNETPQTKRQREMRAMAIIRDCLEGALERLGGEDFFYNMAMNGGEDRRCVALIMSKLIPLEVTGQLNNSVTIEIVKVEMTADGSLKHTGIPLLAAPQREAQTTE